jgi:hypothetical protein
MGLVTTISPCKSVLQVDRVSLVAFNANYLALSHKISRPMQKNAVHQGDLPAIIFDREIMLCLRIGKTGGYLTIDR